MSENGTGTLDISAGPDWRAFGRIMAIGYLRRIGLSTTPAEVLERLQKKKVPRYLKLIKKGGHYE